MFFLLSLLLACSSSDPSTSSKSPPPANSTEADQAQIPETKPAPSPQPAAETTKAPAAKKPAGNIGGIPILPNPIVLGAMDPKKVDAVIDQHMMKINECYTTALKQHNQSDATQKRALRGKVLVKFTIGKDGSVSNVSTKSTSLRNKQAEGCINETIAKATFPAPERGSKALISYPFAFPAM